jgi:3',5'-cyclic AMP phosphodiesterase CpdA
LKNNITTIAVISDPQIDVKDIGGTHEIDLEVLRTCFKHMDVDAVAVCGDITENALAEEMDSVFDTFERYCPAKKLFVVPGNMDGVYNPKTQDVYLTAMERVSGKKCENLYFSHEAENWFMIGISPEPVDDGIITDTQLAFLDDALRKAAERGVPVLIFSHYQLSDTIEINWKYGSLGACSPKVKAVLEKYNNHIIFFSGHTHRGLIAETGGSVITKRNVTYVSVPSICKPDTEHYNADNDNVGTGYVIELNNDQIIIKGYDFLHNEVLDSFTWQYSC